MPPTPPTPNNGKICYIEMPALDIRRSADFYAKVFGWKIRKRATVPRRSTTRRAR